MSSAVWVPAAAGVLAAAAAVMSLWRGGEHQPGSVRRAYLCFGVAAACWAAGLVIRSAVTSGAGGGLTAADLPSLLALAALAVGMSALAAAGPGTGAGLTGGGAAATAARAAAPATAEPDAVRLPRRVHGGLLVRMADGYLLAAALFLIGWVTVLGGDYGRWPGGAGAFVAEMIHPLTDVALLGWLLPLAVAIGRRAALPSLAVLAMTAADALDVGARVVGQPPAAGAQLLTLLALVALALVPRGWPGTAARLPRVVPAIRAAADRELAAQPPADRSVTAMLAAGTAVAAALAVMIWGLAGSPGPGPVVALVGGSAVVALAVRALGLAWRQHSLSRAWREAGQQFRELADRTSDAVLLCDLNGTIRYASPAVAGYGYTPDGLAGLSLAGLLHPEDRIGAARAARSALAGEPTVKYPCRVRAEDGTWRHVQAAVSRYRYLGGPDRLLVTARDVSDQVALRRQVAHLTFHDGLTGLPNRAYAEDRARAVLGTVSTAGGAGVILLDLDGFTAVNDSAGHSAGDLILAQAARRLRAVVPPAGTVARWGGDEFAVLMPEGATAREIIDIAQRLAASISAHAFQVGDREVALTASVGVALADGSPPGYVWRNADAAMSRAKEAGGGRIEIHEPCEDAATAPRLATELQQAIVSGALSLSYQPVAELATGRVVNAVAVVRMSRDPDVPAPVLLAAAEGAGLIVPLGEWVLREACAQASRWRQAGVAAGVWVRVSPAQVVAPTFAESVLAALSASGLPPAALTLEAAERDLVHGGGTGAPGLAEVRAHGVRLAIGDFGTDYASLSYLRRRPVDVVTIDPTFVTGLDADAELAKLVEAIVRVGRDLGIEVVAAGIGQPGQLALLRSMGCQFGLGELVAPAVEAGGMTAVVRLAPVVPAAAGQPEAETTISHSETKLLSS